LEQIRRKSGITQEECARRSGYNVRGWRRIEAGETRPVRQKLIERIVIDALKICDTDTMNTILRFFDYPGIKTCEQLRYALDPTSDTHS
jgi:transcriptional regulator with XRE-family HTH domain